MSKEGSSQKSAETAKSTLTFLDRGASMAKDLVTLGLLTAGDFSQPAALVCLLCKGGLILADPLKKFLSGGDSSKPSLTPAQTYAFLSSIFEETNTLRRSSVHAGRLIDDAETGQCSIEDLELDADDPAASFLALYRAVKSGQQQTQAALQQLLDLQTPAATPAAAIPPELLAENYQALLALIATSRGDIQSALGKHTNTLRQDLSRITETLDRVEGKIDEQTGRLQRMEQQLAELLAAKEEQTREFQQQGRRIEDIPQEEIEADLARRLSLPVETLRARIAVGLKSEDALTRSRAELLAGRRDEAIATAEEAKLHHAAAIRQLIAADQIIAQARYEKAEYLPALAASQRIAALIDPQAEPLAWADAQHGMATILNDLARYAEAEVLLQQVIAINERESGPDDPSLVSSLNSLAVLLLNQGKLAEAEPFCRRALEIGKAKLGKDHPAVAALLNNLAELYRDQGKLEEAEALYRRALEIGESKQGKDHSDVAGGLSNLASLLEDQGKLAEAEPLYRRAIEIGEAKLGKDHPDVARGLNNLAGLLRDQGKLAEAEPLYRRAIEIDEAKLDRNHPNVAIRFNNLANLLNRQGKLAESESLSRRHLLIFFLHRKRNGTPFEHEAAAVGNYSLLLEALHHTPEQIRAEIAAIRKEAGLED